MYNWCYIDRYLYVYLHAECYYYDESFIKNSKLFARQSYDIVCLYSWNGPTNKLIWTLENVDYNSELFPNKCFMLYHRSRFIKLTSVIRAVKKNKEIFS